MQTSNVSKSDMNDNMWNCPMPEYWSTVDCYS